MSSNSLKFKGLQHGNSLEAQSFPSQGANSLNPKRERDLAYIRLRLRCLQVFLGFFFMFITAKSFAQTGSTCGNPYVMNLTNGAGNGEFQFHYPDTVMYVKLTGVEDKQNIILDSILNQQISRISCFENSCNGSYSFDKTINSIGISRVEFNLNFINIDTLLLIIVKENNYAICSSCDSQKVAISLTPTIQATLVCNITDCSNLLKNASFEGFDEAYFTANFFFSQYASNRICSWNQETIISSFGPSYVTTPDYYNFWFDDQVGTQYNYHKIQTPNYPNCQILPQTGNPYFTTNFNGVQASTNQQYPTNSAYAGETILGPNAEILKGELTTPLIPSKRYYFESNLIKRNDGYYGGVINFDLSEAQNYIANNYNGASNFELSVSGFDYNANWKKFNTVFIATNNASYLYIGNLAQNPIAANVSTITPSCPIANPNLYYFFDNIVVKEFFADAGDPNIIACTGSEIGGASCPFPNGTYEWLPANLFVDNTLYHPTFIGTSNTTVSLTVSIVMADGTIEVSDPSYVNVSILPSPSVSILGNTQVLVGNSTTLIASGASYYTWYDNFNAIVGTGASFTTPNLTQTTTYNMIGVDANGCSASVMVTVTVIPLPNACINDPNYPNAIVIPDGTDAVDLIASIPIGNINFSGGEYHITNVNFALAGQLILDSNIPIYFAFCHFNCFDGSEIYNFTGSNTTMRLCTLEACNNTLWKGIRNEGELSFSAGILKDARNGISVAPQSINSISNSVFTNNYIGINILGPCTFVNRHNKFENPDPLFPHWLGWNLPKSLCGINISDAKFVQIDITPTNSQTFTTFRDINCGILCQNTDLLVSNAYFENIADQFGVANHINGTAIYTQGTAAHRLRVFPLNGVNQAITFQNCATGIYHEGYNTRLDYLGMQDVTRGIVGEQLAFCINRMEYNTINASIYGIEMNLIDDVDLFVINHNTITMNSTIARGIAVSAFSNSSSAGSNIKIQGNTIDITRGSVGIEVNNINHPKVNINAISHGLISTNGFATTWHGIKASNCFRADISCNNLTVGAGLIPGNSGADIYVAQSQSTLLACNTTNGESPTGIFLSSGNNGSAIQTNEIGSHGIGLYLDNSCVIGPQPSPGGQPHGNRWNGVYGNPNYNGAGAVNENIWDNIAGQPPILSFANINANKFRIDEMPNVYPFYPANYPDNIYNYNSDPIDNTDWFKEDNTFPTLDACTGGYCPAPFEDHWDDDKKEMGSSINGAIALGFIRTAGYPEETKWLLKKGLINSLSLNDSLLNANDTMQVFYYSIDQENLKKLQQITDTLMMVKLYNQALLMAMQTNDSIMNVLSMAINNLMPLMEDSIIQDSVIIAIATIRNQYAIIADVNESLSMQLNNQRKIAGQQSLNINTGIVPNNFNEYLEQQVNEIYLSTYGQGIDSLSNSDIAKLNYICHICPQAGGPSIYKARALYQLTNDTVTYNDSLVCRNVGYFRESQELLMPDLNEKLKRNSFVIYPNPGKERLKMMITGNTHDGIVSIYNAMGALIESTQIEKESNGKELDISSWAEGYYLVKYQNNNYQSQIKFIKIK